MEFALIDYSDFIFGDYSVDEAQQPNVAVNFDRMTA